LTIVKVGSGGLDPIPFGHRAADAALSSCSNAIMKASVPGAVAISKEATNILTVVKG